MPIKSRLLSAELRSQGVWPAGLEPATRRASGDRSTRAELQPREMHGRGWTRTSSLLFVRQALSAIELLARLLRDKDSNLDLRVQSAASWPLDDPGMDEISMSRHVSDATMLSMPLAYASTLDRDGRC